MTIYSCTRTSGDRGLRYDLSARFNGQGLSELVRAIRACCGVYGCEQIRSVAMRSDGASFSSAQAGQSPVDYPWVSVYEIEAPWSPMEAAEHLWLWLQAERLPLGVTLVKHHADGEAQLAKYPIAPEMSGGEPNEMRIDAFRYRKGWRLTAFTPGNVFEGHLQPAWVR